MSERIERAARYLDETPKPAEYKSAYHFDVPIGWMNDPNGCVRFNGKYHVFYQHNPYWPDRAPMYWGHAVTEDFVHWTNLPPALAPDEEYDKDGCWSGSAIEKDGKLYLMYSGVSRGIQQQCMAYSSDGVNFTKCPLNPVIPESMLPPFSAGNDFRDPYLVKKSDTYYVITGAKDESKRCGRALLFESKDLEHWSYAGEFFRDENITTDGIFECPSYFSTIGGDALITSLNNYYSDDPVYRNAHVPVAYVGKADFDKRKFTARSRQILDYGFDFYAPQIMYCGDRFTEITWMQAWSRSYPTGKFGWIGSLTFPREISIKDGLIVHKPARELDKYCFLQSCGEAENAFFPLVPARVKLTLGPGAGFAVESEKAFAKCEYDVLRGALVMTRGGDVGVTDSRCRSENNWTERVLPLTSAPALDVLVDNASVEVFAETKTENGVMSTTAFFSSDAGIRISKAKYEFYEIKV